MIDELLNNPYIEDKFIERIILNNKGRTVEILVSEHVVDSILERLKHCSVIDAKFLAGKGELVSHPKKLIHSLVESLESKTLYHIYKDFSLKGVTDKNGRMITLPLKEDSFNQRSLKERVEMCHLSFVYLDRNVGSLIEYFINNG